MSSNPKPPRGKGSGKKPKPAGRSGDFRAGKRAPAKRARPGSGAGGGGGGKSTKQSKPASKPIPGKRVRPPDRVVKPPPSSLGAPGQPIRLQRVLSAAGIASRRVAEDLITAGRVSVDGTIVRTLGTRVDPSSARIEVDGERIGVRDDRQYLIMNKPVGVITSARDPFGRQTVMDVARARRRVYPVGRLDSDTSGLLVLTDDGELAHRLAHPRYGVRKVYLAKVAGQVTAAALRRLETVVHLEDGPARAVSAKLRGKASRTSQVELVMTEGRKREVRRMLEAVGHPVIDLVRIGYGPLRLSGLGAGETRSLTPKEVGELYRLVGL